MFSMHANSGGDAFSLAIFFLLSFDYPTAFNNHHTFDLVLFGFSPERTNENSENTAFCLS